MYIITGHRCHFVPASRCAVPVVCEDRFTNNAHKFILERHTYLGHDVMYPRKRDVNS